MLRTEQEARETRCCGGGDCGERKDNYGGYERYCITTHCMAWRWVSELARKKDGSPQISEGGVALTEKVRGYCGIAGKS